MLRFLEIQFTAKSIPSATFINQKHTAHRYKSSKQRTKKDNLAQRVQRRRVYARVRTKVQHSACKNEASFGPRHVFMHRETKERRSRVSRCSGYFGSRGAVCISRAREAQEFNAGYNKGSCGVAGLSGPRQSRHVRLIKPESRGACSSL